MQVPPSSISQICRYNPYIFYLPVISVAFFQQTWSIYDLYAPWTKLSLQKMYVFYFLGLLSIIQKQLYYKIKDPSIQKELTHFEFKNCLRWTAIYLSFTQWRQRMWWYCQQDFDYDTTIFCFISIYIKVIRPWSSALSINLQ